MKNTTEYFKHFIDGLESTIGANLKALPSAILLAILCYIIYKILMFIFNRAVKRLHIDINIVTICKGIIKVLISFFTIMIIASALGINTSSLLAAFSIFGLAISLSIQTTMSNVANAINLYLSTPFKAGDYIKVGDIEGTVKKVSFMHTEVLTYKNEAVYIPNSEVGTSTIINFTKEKYRMIEYTIGVSYDADQNVVKKAIFEMLNEEPLVVKSEPISVFIDKYNSSSIDYTYRVYTENTNYLKCLRGLKERIKPKFDMYKIVIPYNQVDVLIKNK